MANTNSVEALQGTWDYVDDENMDEFFKELGFGLAKRTMAKVIRPRLVISKNGGKWTLRAETALKAMTVEFMPDVEFDDTIPDGREVKTIVRFKDGAMEHTTRDKDGKEWMETRYVNDQGQQQIDIKCGLIQAHRRFKRVQ